MTEPDDTWPDETRPLRTPPSPEPETMEPTTPQRLAAEFLGTFVLVFGGCGSAVLAAQFLSADDVQLGIGFAGVALAFGLTVVVMAYAVGHVSGGHFNPAVTIGLVAAGRFPRRDLVGYILTQLVDAMQGTRTLLLANFRPEYRASWMGKPYCHLLRLAPLSPEAIQQLLHDLLEIGRAAKQRLDQGQLKVGTSDGEHQAGQPRSAADVRHARTLRQQLTQCTAIEQVSLPQPGDLPGPDQAADDPVGGERPRVAGDQGQAIRRKHPLR